MDGELEAWLEIRWEPQKEAQAIIKKLRALQSRVGKRVDLACFALRELLDPGWPLPLRDGIALSQEQDLERVLRVPPTEQHALLEALQRRIEDGYVEEWLRASDEVEAQRILALLKESARLHPTEPLLLAYVLRWCFAPSVGLPFMGQEVADPPTLIALIDGSEAARKEGEQLLQSGWLRQWLLATGRMIDQLEIDQLDRVLADEHRPSQGKLEAVLHLLDPSLPWPKLVCEPGMLDFGTVRAGGKTERSLTVRTEGRGFSSGDIVVENAASGVTLDGKAFQGLSTQVQVNVDATKLPPGSRHEGRIVLTAVDGATTAVPWRFEVAPLEQPKAKWMPIGAAIAFVIVLAALAGVFNGKADHSTAPTANNGTASPRSTTQSDHAHGPLMQGDDVRAMPRPPPTLIQIDECLLYKCGDERWKTKKVIDVLAEPDLASKPIALLPVGSVFKPLTAAWVTVRPNVIRLRKEVPASPAGGGPYVPSGTTIYEYGYWGGGCVTAWLEGYLYGHFEGDIGPSSLRREKHPICLLVDDRDIEQVAAGDAHFWYKLRLSDGRYGWVRREADVGWIRRGTVDNLEDAELTETNDRVAANPSTASRGSAIPATRDVAIEKIAPGESKHNWSLDRSGTVRFGDQIVAKAFDPHASELRISKGNLNGTLRYTVLFDRDKGPWEGYVWRRDAKEILVRIPVRSISDTIFWSPDGAHAIATDSGEVQQRIYVINLQNGRVTPRQIGVPYKVGNCEVQWLYNQPASWVGEAFFRVGIMVEKNPFEANCPDIKARSMSVDIPIS